MREIKFRAWQKHHQRMLEVVNIDFRMNCLTADYGEDTAPRLNTFDIENFVLMEYTGPHDKNGKEIYEADIIEDNVGIGVVEYVESCAAYRVNYRNGKCKWFIDYLDSELKSLEVIGNVYENPELLHKEESK